MLKRIVALAVAIAAVGAVSIAGPAAANAAGYASSTRIAPAAAQVGPGYCQASAEIYFENSYNNGANQQRFWNDTSGVRQLYTKNPPATATGYCVASAPADPDNGILVQFHTSRCLSIDVPNHRVVEGDCAGTNAVINMIFVASGRYEIEFVDNSTKACIYQGSQNSPVTYGPCTPGQTGDVWIELVNI
jgi:hypothetical protein